MIKRILE